jgi:hypothetical protein
MSRLYHRTSPAIAQLILREGFRDATGRFMTDQEFRGVWLSDRPLGENDGAAGDALLQVDVALADDAIDEYEWREKGKPYREWLVPAALINAHAQLTIIEEEI